jgi:hypothetical protein
VDLSEFSVAEAGSSRAKVSIARMRNEVEGSKSRNPWKQASPMDIVNNIKRSIFAEWEQSAIQ